MPGFKTEEHELPMSWAGYLVNGDPSGLDDLERRSCDDWLDLWELTIAECASVSDETRFGLFDAIRYELATYTFLVRIES